MADTAEPTGLVDVESEHVLQYRLLSEAERLLAAGDGQRGLEVIRQLHRYSEVHFGSEQVLMRLHAYPGYQAHEREHGELLAALDVLIANIDDATAAASAESIRRWLTSHIHHSDQAFVEHMKSAT